MCVDGLVVLIEFPRVDIFIDGGIQMLVDLILILLKHSVHIYISLKFLAVSLETRSILNIFHFRFHLDAHRDVAVLPVIEVMLNFESSFWRRDCLL